MFLFLLGATFIVASAFFQFSKIKPILILSLFLLVAGMIIVGYGFISVNTNHDAIVADFITKCASMGGDKVEEYMNLQLQCWNTETSQRIFF